MPIEESSQRSSGGCLTCKKRKKKCDEARPRCKRCVDGDFQCLGYQYLESWESMVPVPQLPRSLYFSTRPVSYLDTTESTYPSTSREYPADAYQNQAMRRSSLILTGPVVPTDVYLFVVSYYTLLGSRIIFRPTRVSAQGTVIIVAKGSKLRLWSFYIGSKISRALFNGYEDNCSALIEEFCGRIQSSSYSEELDAEDLALRLSCLQDMALYTSMTVNSYAAHQLLKQTVPVFVRLASEYPRLWSPTQTVLIVQALYHPPHYHLCKFVFYDTMAALTFARPPLVHYETRSSNIVYLDPRSKGRILEWVYGCSISMIVVIAKINAWRAGTSEVSWTEDWRELEREIVGWTLWADHVDDSMGRVMRLAIQESWRHAVLIYLYMGMCEVDSTDPRVEAAVQQVSQLAETVPAGDLLENHLFVPCLLAGIAARQEVHRQILRQKIAISKNENVWYLRGADFVPVLDRLWHEAGRDGWGVKWNDYSGLIGAA